MTNISPDDYNALVDERDALRISNDEIAQQLENYTRRNVYLVAQLDLYGDALHKITVAPYETTAGALRMHNIARGALDDGRYRWNMEALGLHQTEED